MERRVAPGSRFDDDLPGLPRTVEGGRLSHRDRLYVLELAGTPAERGRAHAALVGDGVGAAPLAYYRDLLERLGRSPAMGLGPATARAGAALVFAWRALRQARFAWGPLQEELAAFLDALGLPSRERRRLADTLFFPDILHRFAGRIAHGDAAACSAFFARGSATADGRLLVGRNFDFFGAGLWDRWQALQVRRPADGQPWAWIGPLGLPVGGFGCNRAGIAVMPFTNFTRDTRVAGRPLFAAFAETLEQASTLDEAVAILSRAPRSGGYSVLVVDASARDARAIGVGAKHVETVTPADDRLVRTNHLATDAARACQTIDRGWIRHSEARAARLHDLLDERRGTLTVADVPVLLADDVDPVAGRRALVGNIVATANNALSLAWAPDDDALYVGTGTFPVARSASFAGFRLSSLWDGPVESMPSLAGPATLTDAERGALANYVAGWNTQFLGNDAAGAALRVRAAAAAAPGDAALARAAALQSIAAGDLDYADTALSRAEALAAGTQYAPELALWRARHCDLVGARGRALAIYGELANAPGMASAARETVTAARDGLRRRYSRRRQRHAAFEFVTVTMR